MVVLIHLYARVGNAVIKTTLEMYGVPGRNEQLLETNAHWHD